MMKLNIQLFADGKIVIDTQLNSKNFENGLSRMQNATKTAGSTIKNIVVGLGISKLISKSVELINSSLDTAISRFDILNNFTKVMSNLGIGAEASQKSIDKLVDKLQGLPTTLQDGAMAVQRFASANSDIEKSTDLFLALNNAILAGGASSEIQASALEQLSQAYAKGRPDMMEWRTAMMAMPAQLKQVAKAMGYINADALGEALRNGTVSMDDFMDTIVRLNTEGVDGFKSFEEQARNSTEGIRTSLTVLKGRVAQGVTSIIESIDKKLKESNLGGISELIINFANGMRGGLRKIGEVIEGDTEQIIINWLEKLKETGPKAIEKFTDGITKGIPKIANTAGNILKQFVDTLKENVSEIYDSGLEIATTLIESISDQLPKLMPEIIELIIELFMEITKPENLDKISKAGSNLVIKLIEGILKSIPELIENTDFLMAAFKGVLSGGTSYIKDIGFSFVKALIKGLINAIPDLAEAAFKIIKEFLDKLKSSDIKFGTRGTELIGKFIKGIKDGGLDYIKDVGRQLIEGLWNGIQEKWNKLKNKVGELGGSIVQKFKDVFGIKSPSRVFRDEIGKFLPLGMYEGFNDELDNVYGKMQKAINFENAKLQANVETGKVFNTLANTTPVYVQVDADVEMDHTKVGRIITPVVSETLKTGGLK